MFVEIWKVRDGVDRSTAIASMLDCAELFGTDDERSADARSYVNRVYKCNDKCASSANAGPMGFRTRLNMLSAEQYLEFNRCFHFKEVDLKRLKVFAANSTEKNRSPSQMTRSVNNLLILALDKKEVFAILSDKYPTHNTHVFTVEEIEGPFTTGQILMDDGGHTMHDLDIAKRANS